jgi:uncharacterized protein YecT (DUF1311 family)
MKNAAMLFAVLATLLPALCAGAQSQVELTDRANQDLQKADKELNTVYKQVMLSLDDAGKEALKQSQVAWIKYRDLCAKSECDAEEGGSIQPMLIAIANTELTREKTKRLRGMLPGSVARNKVIAPDLDTEKAAFEKADADLNKVYKAYVESEGDATIKDTQKAWLEYRDLCAKAESAPYDKDTAPAVAAKCTAELTKSRTARIKALFVGDEVDEKAENQPEAKK